MDAATLDTPNRDSTGPESARAIQILLVDDSRRVRESAQTLLEQRGYQIHLVDNGFDALCRIVAQPPDIVFMAAAMPELDGYESCALVNANPQYAHIPIVLMVTDKGPLELARADIAGARCVLVKPFGKRDLLEAVAQALCLVAGNEGEQDANDSID